jgi:hypothetical protein
VASSLVASSLVARPHGGRCLRRARNIQIHVTCALGSETTRSTAPSGV